MRNRHRTSTLAATALGGLATLTLMACASSTPRQDTTGTTTLTAHEQESTLETSANATAPATPSTPSAPTTPIAPREPTNLTASGTAGTSAFANGSSEKPIGVAGAQTGVNSDLSHMDTPNFDDAQVAEAATAILKGESDQARYAQEHASSTKVKVFTQHILTADQVMSAKLAAAMQSANIVSNASRLSTAFQANAAQILSDMQQKTGKDLDSAYLSSLIVEEQNVLDIVDNKLTPSASSAPLKDALKQIRPLFAEHLREAKSIQGQLGK